MKRLIPISNDGWHFIIPSLLVSAVFFFFSGIWAGAIKALGLIFAGFCFFFFRDFDRDTPSNDEVIYSPVDGRVLGIETVRGANGELEKIIRIFMSVFDAHVQRSPVHGVVESIEHTPGQFLDARSKNAHLENEQNELVIDSGRGKIRVRQIAGFIARRIVCWACVGRKLSQGERYGLIRFGSQVDLLVPKTVEISVSPGEKVMGGMTVMGRWEAKSPIVKCDLAETPRFGSN